MYRTSSGRTITPPIEQLRSTVSYAKSQLEEYIYTSNVYPLNKGTLKEKWRLYKSTSQALMSTLDKEGASAEMSDLVIDYKDIQRRTKMESDKFRRDFELQSMSSLFSKSTEHNQSELPVTKMETIAENKTDNEDEISEEGIQKHRNEIESILEYISHKKQSLVYPSATAGSTEVKNENCYKKENYASINDKGVASGEFSETKGTQRNYVESSKADSSNYSQSHHSCDQGVKKRVVSWLNGENMLDALSTQSVRSGKQSGTTRRYPKNSSNFRINSPNIIPRNDSAHAASYSQIKGPNEGLVTDYSARYLILSELKKTPAFPFNGNPCLFQDWFTALKHKIEPLQLSPIDQIEVFYANTVGEPRQLIETFRSVHRSDPTYALAVIEDKLSRRFGADSDIAKELMGKMDRFPLIRGAESDPDVALKVRQLSDLCVVIGAHMKSIPDLKLFDLPSGLEILRHKLPDFLNSRWRNSKFHYLKKYNVHPSFHYFCEFLEEKADQLCDDLSVKESNILKDAKLYRSKTKSPKNMKTFVVEMNETDTEQSSCSDEPAKFKCPLHRSNSHEIKDCYVFTNLDMKLKRFFVSSYLLCYKCLSHHLAVNCRNKVNCEKCKADSHLTVMHYERKFSNNPKFTNERNLRLDSKDAFPKNSFCSTVCGQSLGRSCSKTVLVDLVSKFSPSRSLRVYAIIDEQSSHTFATSKVFDHFNANCQLEDYHLQTLTSSQKLSGRTLEGLVVKGVLEKDSYSLPKLYENNGIPDTKDECANPVIISKNLTISKFSCNFPEIDNEADVCLLIGRDSGDIMGTKSHSKTAPFVHQTPLGWAVVGSICPFGSSLKASAKVLRTKILKTEIDHEHFSAMASFSPIIKEPFAKFADDEDTSLSKNDRKFVDLVSNNIVQNYEGNLQAPLPIRNEDLELPDNKFAVFCRQKNSLMQMKKDNPKLEQCLRCMQKMIKGNHVEQVPISQMSVKHPSWYLPVFPVMHPKKGKWRLVFDSAAKYSNVSLNSSLLQGPDHNNSLRGVLIRFRENKVGFVSDIEAMFHSFHVSPENRDLMRFY